MKVGIAKVGIANRLELVGKPFMAEYEPGKRYKLAVFKCECGNHCIAKVINVKTDRTKSCGCLKRELLSRRKTKHGKTGHPLHNIWRGMISRCSNESVAAYPRYGGRGISVCDQWQSFRPFYDWSMSSGWRPGLEIDRIDNDGDYSPENCRFVSAKVNANNRSSNRIVKAFGESKTLAEWSRDERCRVAYATLKRRLNGGWSATAAISKPSLR